MKRASLWALLPALCLFALPANGQSTNVLKLGQGIGKVGTNVSVPLTLTTTDQVQGLVASFEWTGGGTGVSLTPGAAIATADTVVRRVEANYMVLGVVMDSDGQDGEIIAPGNDLDVATAVIRCGDTEGETAITFDLDAEHATVDGGPGLENLVVVGGLSISATEGLQLIDGRLTCQTVVNKYSIAPGASNSGGRCGDAKVLMDNKSAVEGYVTALCHDASVLDLDSISVGQAALDQGADFSSSEVSAAGGTLGVVIDLVAPFTNNTIPAGEGNHIATYRYCCKTLPTSCDNPTTTPLTFCDNVLGTPLKENVFVVGGQSVSPVLENGVFTCKALGTPENCTNGVDDDCDGDIDAADDDCQQPGGQMFACGSAKQDASGNPGPLQASIGSSTVVCFYYKSPEDNAPGHAQKDHIQGFSMALTYCCDVSARPSLDIAGTIVEAVGAEFVSVQADNDPADGDGCELIIGVLVDALPPFDGATLPPTSTLARVGCVTFDVKDDAALCGKCCDIKFTDGVNGQGKIPIKNLISVENQSVSPQTMNCQLCIVDKERFYRGDCNFSRMGSMAVDIADAASVVSYLFLPGTWKFNPPCLDACDCNDDGRIDLADAVCVLQYLFQQGRFPPAPGPGLRMEGGGVAESPAGEDPTDDKLDCKAGNACGV